MAREIPLTKGYVAIVDDEDYERVMSMLWHVHIHPRSGYVRAVCKVRGRVRFLHRWVLQLEPGDPVVDHRNGNPLDCRRCNLRVCSQAENARNRKAPKRPVNEAVRLKGIYPHSSGGWSAHIGIGGQRLYLGRFPTPDAAAAAYNAAAVQEHGSFARLNAVHDEMAVQPITRTYGAAWGHRKHKGGQMPYKGIATQRNGRYYAYINAKGKRYHLGTFDTAEEAARAYNLAALKYHGDRAVLNVIPD